MIYVVKAYKEGEQPEGALRIEAQTPDLANDVYLFAVPQSA